VIVMWSGVFVAKWFNSVCLESRQISWVQEKELVDLSVSSNWVKMPVFGTVLKLNEVL
jgi:hypothetical protein